MSQQITVYGTTWCADCHATKRALSDCGIPFEEVNIDDDPQAAEYVQQVNQGRRSVPTLVYGEHAQSLSRFTPAKLQAFLTQTGLS